MNKKLDIIILILVLNLVVIGLISIYSATNFEDSANYFEKQLVWSVFGLLLMIAINYLPPKIFQKLTLSIYAFSVILLILVLFIGKSGMGAERWLVFGSVRIQPSEFAKLATVLAVSKVLSQKYANVNNLKTFIQTIGIIILPFMLIARQPDLGTALVFLAIIIPLLFWAGLNWFSLFVIITPLLTMILSFEFWAFMILMIIVISVLIFSKKKILTVVSVFVLNIAVGITTPVIWEQLHPYQQKRILTFLNPEKDPKGAGYQIIQSQVAIGSGGLWGRGYLEGSQTHLRFLPAQHTDFIFSVIGEEFGFVGVTYILLVFMAIILRIIWLAGLIRNMFSSLVLIGIATILLFHVFINVAMTIGFAPVTGLPLPFISYGGSFLLTNLLMMGVVLNISRNRFAIF